MADHRTTGNGCIGVVQTGGVEVRRSQFDARPSPWSAMVDGSLVPARPARCVLGRGVSSPADLVRPPRVQRDAQTRVQRKPHRRLDLAWPRRPRSLMCSARVEVDVVSALVENARINGGTVQPSSRARTILTRDDDGRGVGAAAGLGCEGSGGRSCAKEVHGHA